MDIVTDSVLFMPMKFVLCCLANQIGCRKMLEILQIWGKILQIIQIRITQVQI